LVLVSLASAKLRRVKGRGLAFMIYLQDHMRLLIRSDVANKLLLGYSAGMSQGKKGAWENHEQPDSP
jgi:hypothetical protein